MKLSLRILAAVGVALSVGWQATFAQTPTPCSAFDDSCNQPLASIPPSPWFGVAAKVLGVDPASLYGGTQSLAVVAAQQAVSTTLLSKAIYNSEKQQIVADLRSGSISVQQARRMLRVARSAATSFVMSDVGSLASNVDVQRAIWKSQNISNYRFDLSQSCYCFGLPPYVTVIVKNGVAVDVLPPPDWWPEGTTIQVDQALMPYVMSAAEKQSYLKSFEDLFKLTESAETYPAYSLMVQYHSEYGFPTKIAIDYSQMIADEEQNYTISNFQVLP